MTYIITIIVLLASFILMAAGLLLAKKTLKRGCSLGDDCTCKNDPQKSVSEDCEHKIK